MADNLKVNDAASIDIPTIDMTTSIPTDYLHLPERDRGQQKFVYEDKRDCAVPGCTSELRKLEKPFLFHRFPSAINAGNIKTRDAWIDVIRKVRKDAEWIPKEFDGICSRHFLKKDRVNNGQLRPFTINHLAIPCLNLPADPDGDGQIAGGLPKVRLENQDNAQQPFNITNSLLEYTPEAEKANDKFLEQKRRIAIIKKAKRVHCAIPRCAQKLDKNTSYHSMKRLMDSPIYTKTKDAWIDFIRKARKDASWNPTETVYLCSRHFLEEDCIKNGVFVPLDISAVPCLNMERKIHQIKSNVAVEAVTRNLAAKKPQQKQSMTESESDKTKYIARYECVIPGCTLRKRMRQDHISYHVLPNPQTMRNVRNAWIAVIQKAKKDPTWTPAENIMYRVCSRHFHVNEVPRQGRKIYLNPLVVPSLHIGDPGPDFDGLNSEEDIMIIEPDASEVQSGLCSSGTDTEIGDPLANTLGIHELPEVEVEIGMNESRIIYVEKRQTTSSISAFKETTRSGESDTTQHERISKPRAGPSCTDKVKQSLEDRVEFLETTLLQSLDTLTRVSSQLNAMQDFLQKEFGPRFPIPVINENVAETPITTSSSSSNTNIHNRRRRSDVEIDDATDDFNPLAYKKMRGETGIPFLNVIQDESQETSEFESNSFISELHEHEEPVSLPEDESLISMCIDMKPSSFNEIEVSPLILERPFEPQIVEVTGASAEPDVILSLSSTSTEDASFISDELLNPNRTSEYIIVLTKNKTDSVIKTKTNSLVNQAHKQKLLKRTYPSQKCDKISAPNNFSSIPKQPISSEIEITPSVSFHQQQQQNTPMTLEVGENFQNTQVDANSTKTKPLILAKRRGTRIITLTDEIT